jgi:hypothetical protein
MRKAAHATQRSTWDWHWYLEPRAARDCHQYQYHVPRHFETHKSVPLGSPQHQPSPLFVVRQF